MSEKPISVLLIEDDPADAESVKNMLLEAEGVPFIPRWASTLVAGLDELGQGDVDVILLDLCLPDSSGLETFNTTLSHAPGVPIVLLTGVDSDLLALMAVQGGAQDYLVKSTLTTDSLARALRYAIVRQRSKTETSKTEAPAEPGKLIGFLGAKGGVGTTTVACHLGLELRRQTDEPVLLADLDLNAGLMGFLTNATSQYSILDAAANFYHLDMSCWKSIVSSGADGLEVIQSPGPMSMEEAPKPDRIRYVLQFGRHHHRWVILDLGRLSPLSIGLIPELNELMLVTTPGVLALYEAKRVAQKLMDLGFDRSRLHLILNRARKLSAISSQEVERTVGLGVFGILPSHTDGLDKAYREGKLLSESNALRVQIGGLAAKLAGIEKKKIRRRSSLPRFGVFFGGPKPTAVQERS